MGSRKGKQSGLVLGGRAKRFALREGDIFKRKRRIVRFWIKVKECIPVKVVFDEREHRVIVWGKIGRIRIRHGGVLEIWGGNLRV
jgi:hypothetical protein